mmetsp:Transcript_40990/g.110838  ORF Transcript_40990/g.110838 Transcript_40990/m.110838 type:complete len:217 (-) Transcript_40990:121-771(-)
MPRITGRRGAAPAASCRTTRRSGTSWTLATILMVSPPVDPLGRGPSWRSAALVASPAREGDGRSTAAPEVHGRLTRRTIRCPTAGRSHARAHLIQLELGKDAQARACTWCALTATCPTAARRWWTATATRSWSRRSASRARGAPSAGGAGFDAKHFLVCSVLQQLWLSSWQLVGGSPQGGPSSLAPSRWPTAWSSRVARPRCARSEPPVPLRGASG